MSYAVLTFDPYVAWLSVRDDNRPLSPYQLLVLEPLETSPGKINAAVGRQRRALESVRAGANEEVWQQVHDELEAAIKQLTDVELKAMLDASIIRKSGIARMRKSSGEKAPAGPVIACRKCKKENSSLRRFCGDCGSMLWDGCGSCGAEVPVDEKFCGICGSNLHDTASAEIVQAEATLEEARQLRGQFEYDAAKVIARKLAKAHDPRLDQLANEAIALLRNIDQDLLMREQEAADALERAKMLLSGNAYEGAIAELSEIAPPFRSEEFNQVLAQATAKRNEILTLSGDIRAAIEAKRTNELLPKIERLLALKPNHEQALKLAGQLRDRYIVAAKKKMLEHCYAEAIEMLRQIPPFVHTPEISKLLDHSEELKWLIDDLKHQPIVSPTLAEFAERLIKAAPAYAEAPKLKEQITARLAKELPTDPRHRYHAWSAVPKKTYVDWPIDWLTGVKNFRFANATHQKLFEEHPGRFAVAIGLALQGVDKAPLDLNFITEEKKFSLKQFSSFMRKKADRFAWGIDLNAFGLKAVKLERNDKDGSVTIIDAVFIKHRKLLSQPDAELEQAALCEETIKEFLTSRTLDDARIVANIPSHKMLGRFFDLPAIELKKVPDAVEYETRHQLPYALNELIWDWSLVSFRELAEHEDTRRVVVMAGRDFYVTERIASLKQWNLAPHVLTTDSIALHNFLLHEFFTGETDQAEVGHEAIVLLDVGTEASTLVISSPSVHWSRNLNVGGDRFTEPLIKQFKLTHSQAELLKREPHRARKILPLYETFDPLFEELAAEINRSLDTFQQLYPDQTLSRIYGTGGGFPLHGLWKKLRSGK